MNRHLLLVAYYFPPLGGIGSVRALRFAQHLPAFGWDVTVLAPSNGAYHRDESLVFPEEQVIRAPSIELSRVGKKALFAGGGDSTAAVVGGTRARLRAAARRWMYWPDAQRGWEPGALLVGRRALRRHQFDAVMSSSFPITSHLVARRLARRAGVPWIAEFRDPWSDVLVSSSNEQARAGRLERQLIRDCTALVTVSPSWAELFRMKGAHGPVSVITNGLDSPIEPNSDEGNADDHFVLTHVGTMSLDFQDHRTVWRAVATARAAGVDLVDELRFVGELPGSARRELDALGLGDLVRITGFVSHPRALDELRSSGALVAAGDTEETVIANGRIAAKVFEYLGTLLPIVYVGPEESDAAQLLAGYEGCFIVAPGDVAGTQRALESARGRRFRRDTGTLAPEILSGRLAALLGQVCR